MREGGRENRSGDARRESPKTERRSGAPGAEARESEREGASRDGKIGEESRDGGTRGCGRRDALGRERCGRRTRGAVRERDPRVQVGRRGEAAAERYLAGLGYRLLERRFRTRNGEIDLVMADGATIVFVEVRCRRTARCGDPLESVGPAKQGFLIRAARLYLLVRGLFERSCRFDVIAIRDDESGGEPQLRHITDAFRADGRA